MIDDHSRLAVWAAYYPRADTQAFHHALKNAIQSRGVPAKLYTDQGGPFVNDHTRLVCANLEIRLLHAKPYHAWSKGKVERFIQTVQRDFEARIRAGGQALGSIDELNHRLADWLASVYHRRVHQSTEMSPSERFTKGSHHIRPLDPDIDIERLFFQRTTRTVRKDGTIRLGNQLYEVDLAVENAIDPSSRRKTLAPISDFDRLQGPRVIEQLDPEPAQGQIQGSHHYDR